jgi:hypothetical protein
MADLRKSVDSFVKKMEGISEKRMKTAHEEMQYCMHEAHAFNELRQTLHAIDKEEFEKLTQKELRKSVRD